MNIALKTKSLLLLPSPVVYSRESLRFLSLFHPTYFLPASDIWRRASSAHSSTNSLLLLDRKSVAHGGTASRGASHEKVSLRPLRSFNPVRRRDRDCHSLLHSISPFPRVSYDEVPYFLPSRISGCIDRSHLITNSGTKMRWRRGE